MKKAQMWSIDLMVAFTIFSVGILVFLIYSFNYGAEAKENFEKLSSDGEIILDNLLSEGFPADWDGELTKIGVRSNNELNETKLEKFYNLSNTDYEKTKALFNTNYDYYFFMDKTITTGLGEIDGIGKSGVTRDNIGDTVNLIKLTRFSIYKKEPITVYLYIWE